MRGLPLGAQEGAANEHPNEHHLTFAHQLTTPNRTWQTFRSWPIAIWCNLYTEVHASHTKGSIIAIPNSKKRQFMPIPYQIRTPRAAGSASKTKVCSFMPPPPTAFRWGNSNLSLHDVHDMRLVDMVLGDIMSWSLRSKSRDSKNVRMLIHAHPISNLRSLMIRPVFSEDSLTVNYDLGCLVILLLFNHMCIGEWRPFTPSFRSCTCQKDLGIERWKAYPHKTWCEYSKKYLASRQYHV